MSTIIKPTVGRKVWYRPSKYDLVGPIPMFSSGEQPLDATIVAVWGDRMVNVAILDIYGTPFRKTSVKLLQEGDTPERNPDGELLSGYVEWMPFQTGQAKKTEVPA